ncbi:MAG: DUF3021 domain-containing protein [Lachnospiraceae bacterium]|nr:DUF3021 domain-containing protein [Lachnospiraceae bacterium]
MWKKCLWRGAISFTTCVTVNVLILMAKTMSMVRMTGDKQTLPDLVPEYAAHFENPFMALMVQTLLCGLIGFAFGACSVIMEIAKWSMVRQAVVHFVLTACVWVPVSIFCWGLGRYRISFICVFLGMLFTYAVTWTCQIIVCRKEVARINEQLLAREAAEGGN